MKLKKKGQLGGAMSLIFWGAGIIVLVVLLTLGAVMIDDLKDDTDAGSNARNITEDGEAGMKEMSSKLDTIVIAVVFGLILTILFGIIYVVKRGAQ